jgi:alpha-amylase/alpha-mannosidase (GH57 family)
MPRDLRRAALAAALFLLAFGLPAWADDAAAARADDIIYLNLVWHQHQPLYYKDPATGIYTRPWVRVHATKDYYDMAATVAKYPGVHVTFNLTPVLLRQLDDLAAGAKDIYQVLAEKPAASLTDDDRKFILERFFDANRDHVIKRFPRYAQLLALRDGAGSTDAALKIYTADDFRDLQVWFNLAWFDPDALAVPPLAGLVARGRSFAESDKKVIFDEALKIIRQVVPIHKLLQEKGQIEIITTPYAHPILPLLYSTALAARGDPTAPLPDWYSFANDAVAQVNKSVKIYQDHYGRKPRGMWPAEGAVAPEIVKMVQDAGYQWMASGEQVLARSLGLGDITRDSSDLVNQADALYRPYFVKSRDGASVAMVFRDLRLSDLIGFEYSGTPGEQAAADLMRRIEAIRTKLKAGPDRGPHLVSIILDGENAWENYDNDGKEFLNAFYRMLSQSTTVRTIIVSEYLKLYPQQRQIDNLWSGAWFSADYATWIGEPEENTAWSYLARVRKDLAEYDVYKRKKTSQANLDKALDFMYLAEGSDWFWWYGSDQDSGNDAYFDMSFRSLLTGVYASLGVAPPDFLKAPIVAQASVPASKPLDAGFTPVIDGKADPGEWDKAARYDYRGGVMAGGADRLQALYFGIDDTHAYFRVDGNDAWTPAPGRAVRIYLAWDPASPTGPFTVSTSVLGYGASAYVEAAADGNGWRLSVYRRGKYDNWAFAGSAGAAGSIAVVDRAMEIGVPLALLGDVSAGSAVKMRAAYSEGSRDAALLPGAGPLEVVLPLIGQAAPFLTVDDPTGDDNGPGTYVYPTDAVFKAGVFDLTKFSVAETDKDLVFSFAVKAPIDNPWGSAIRLSVQAFDVYIDADPGKATGARMLLDGRNAALQKGNAWDYAIWVEGWNQKVFSADPGGKVTMLPGSPLKVTVDGPKGIVLVTLPKSVLRAGADPKTWGYAAVVLSQDGYPAPGVLRVRDVKATAEQWRIGGAGPGVNGTRIMDVAWSGTPTQAQILSAYKPLDASGLAGASPDDFAQIPLVTAAGN